MILSKYTNTNFLFIFLSTLSIAHWNVAGALQRPNGIMLNSNSLCFVTKAVFALSSSQTFNCQYPDAKSNVVYQEVSLSDSNNSSI